MLNQGHEIGSCLFVGNHIYDMWLAKNQFVTIQNGCIGVNGNGTAFAKEWEVGGVIAITDGNGNISSLAPKGYLRIPEGSRIDLVYHEIANNPIAQLDSDHTRTFLVAKGASEIEHHLDQYATGLRRKFPKKTILRIRKYPGITALPADDPQGRVNGGSPTLGASVFAEVCILILPYLRELGNSDALIRDTDICNLMSIFKW